MKDLLEKLLEAKRAYYNGTPIMSDYEFDNLEEELRKISPNHKYFSIVGISARGVDEIEHKFPLLSCAKSKSVWEVENWLEKIDYDGNLVLMAKVDGLTGSLSYRDGKLSHIATRGDGKIGQDISHIADYLNIPKEINIKEDVEIIGELYIPKDTEMKTRGKPLRNIASGLVNRKEVSEDLKYLKFVAFNMYGVDYPNFLDRLHSLENMYFEVVEYSTAKKMKTLEEYFEDYENNLRTDWIYETDGLVIQVDDVSQFERINNLYVLERHHHYNMALKPTSESATTSVTGISWQVSGHGNIIPVCQFNTVYLGNKNINNATLHNYQNVKDLDIRVGTVIEVLNSNDVIPYVKNVIREGEGKSLLIDKCPSCRKDIIFEGVHAKCTNQKCKGIIIEKITNYCKKCEMDGVSKESIADLYEAGLIKDVIGLYHLEISKDTILKIEGWGSKKVENLFKQIEKSREQTIAEFVSRLGIENIGIKTVENLGIKTLDDFWNFNSKDYVTGRDLITYRDANKIDISQLLKYIIIREESEMDLPKVCFTGKGPKIRKELMEDIKAKGFEFSSSINKDLKYLICEDVSGSSSKLVRARKLGIEIISYEEFFK